MPKVLRDGDQSPTARLKLYVDPGVCIDCGTCADACPNEAIFRSYELPSKWAAYARIDATWYRDPAAARAFVNETLSVAG